MIAVHLLHMVMVTEAYEVDKIERTKQSLKVLIFMYLLAKVYISFTWLWLQKHMKWIR